MAAVGYASVQARVRARRSRLLGADDWRRLVEAAGLERTLEALAGTPYADVARSPGHAERTLRRRVYRETLALAEDVPPRGRELLHGYASRTLVRDLDSLIRALHYGRSPQEALEATTLGPEVDPALAAPFRARTLAGLVASLEGTLWGRALSAAWERYRAEQRPFYLEVALDLAFRRALVKRIDALGGGDAGDAERLLGRWLARTNLLAAARYRAMPGVRPEEIVNFCLHRDFGGGLAMVQRIAAGGSIRDEAAALGVTLTGEGGDREAILELERRIDASRREEAELRFARVPFGLGLVLAYLILLEAETDDLIRVLEAKAQGLDADALRERLPREVS